MIKQILKWQFFLGIFIAIVFFILGAVLATFLFMKNIDVAGIKKDHEYLKRQYEMLKKEQTISNNISDYIDRAKAITDYNEEAIVESEEEEGK